MGLLRIISIVILILQSYGARGVDLPELQRNELLVGPARYETAIPLSHADCSDKSDPTKFALKISGTFKPSEVLKKPIFNKFPFFSVVAPEFPDAGAGAVKFGGVGKFTFTKAEHKGETNITAYILHVDWTGNSGEHAYWLPQGGSIDIPQTPQETKDGRQVHPNPKYVFTPNFSGCSWTVTPLSNGMLRIRHVEGDKENPQFNNQTLSEKGGSRSYAMQYKDYGYIKLNNKKIEIYKAYAYMHFFNGAWSLYIQQGMCTPNIQNLDIKKGKLQPITMTYDNKNGYDMISDTKVFRINLN